MFTNYEIEKQVISHMIDEINVLNYGIVKEFIKNEDIQYRVGFVRGVLSVVSHMIDYEREYTIDVIWDEDLECFLYRLIMIENEKRTIISE